MRNLLYLLFRYSALIVFLLFQFISLYLIVSFNKSQNEIWVNSSNIFSGKIQERAQKVEDFFTQQQLNDSLLRENAKLLETIINFRVFSEKNSFQTFETIGGDSLRNYSLIPARVCSKTINLRNNFLTLCIGSEDGVNVGMGVISKDGVIGIVKRVSKKYSTVLMMTNGQSRISAMILGKGNHGNLIWTSNDIRSMTLVDVPKHAIIEVGDTIVTSGYSISFPPQIPIGKVSDFTIKGGSNNYDIEVDLGFDLSTIKTAYVIKFDKSEEKEILLNSEDE